MIASQVFHAVPIFLALVCCNANDSPYTLGKNECYGENCRIESVASNAMLQKKMKMDSPTQDVCTNLDGGFSMDYPCHCGKTSAATTICDWNQFCKATDDSDGTCSASVVGSFWMDSSAYSGPEEQTETIGSVVKQTIADAFGVVRSQINFNYFKVYGAGSFNVRYTIEVADLDQAQELENKMANLTTFKTAIKTAIDVNAANHGIVLRASFKPWRDIVKPKVYVAHPTAVCQGDFSTFDAGYGNCLTYNYSQNGAGCASHVDQGFTAQEVCPECYRCKVNCTWCYTHYEFEAQGGCAWLHYENDVAADLVHSSCARDCMDDFNNWCPTPVPTPSTPQGKVDCGAWAKDFYANGGCSLSVDQDTSNVIYAEVFPTQCFYEWYAFDYDYEEGNHPCAKKGKECQGDFTTFNAGYGKCAAYSTYPNNCATHMDQGFTAEQVCPECGKCEVVCQRDRNTFNAGYGSCATYSDQKYNCPFHVDQGLTAAQVCPECRKCKELFPACESAKECGPGQFCSVSCFQGHCPRRFNVCQPCEECHYDDDASGGGCLALCNRTAVSDYDTFAVDYD